MAVAASGFKQLLAPTAHRLTGSDQLRCAIKQMDDADQHGRPVHPPVLLKTGGKVDHGEAITRDVGEPGLQDVGILNIALDDMAVTGRGNSETAAFRVKQFTE